MNKPFKTLSTTALAAVLAASALVPAASAAPTTQAVSSLDSVIVSINNENVNVSLEDYANLLELGKIQAAQVKFVQTANGSNYTLSEYSDYLDLKKNVNEAAGELEEKGNKQNVPNVKQGNIVNGELVVGPAIEEEFKVDSIAAINETGVTVNFPSSEQDLTDVTVEVKDPSGTVVPVKTIPTIVAGETSVTFEFETALEIVTPGNWTVNGVTYEVLEPAVIAEAAVVKAEESLLDADVAAAKVEVAKLPASTTQTKLNIRIGAVESASKSFVDNVNAAANNIELYNALNAEASPFAVKPLTDVIKANVTEYAKLLGKAQAAQPTLKAIQDAVDTANKAAGEATLAQLVQEATTAVEEVPAYSTVDAEAQTAFEKAVTEAQTAIDALPADSTEEAAETPKADLQKELDGQVSLNSDWTAKVQPVVKAKAKGQFALYDALTVAGFKNIKTANIVEYVEAINAQTTVKDVQYAIDHANADKAVSALAVVPTQAQIDAAKALVDVLPNTGAEDPETGEATPAGEKVQLLATIKTKQDARDAADKAENALSKAKSAVAALTTGEGETLKLAEGVDQNVIDAAQELVTALPADSVEPDAEKPKADLQADIDAAQSLLDTATLEATEEAVAALFVDETKAALAKGVKQATIDAASKLVEALPADEGQTTTKVDLQADIVTAQGFLDVANLEAATNAADALFAKDSEGETDYTKLASEVNQATIDAASKLVEALPADGTELGDLTPKADLQAVIEDAQELLDVATINAAIKNDDVTALQTIIVGLENAKFAGLSKAQRAELGAYIIVTATKEETTFASTSDFNEAISAVGTGYVDTYLADVKAFNDAANTDYPGANPTTDANTKKAVIAAINKVTGEDFLKGLSELQKLDLAESILEAKPETNYAAKTVAQIKAIVDANRAQ